MLVDMHFHINRSDENNQPHSLRQGCVVSRQASTNEDCFRYASRLGIACALFADSTAPDWPKIINLVKQRCVLAYKHIEQSGFVGLEEAHDLFRAAERAGLPVILHISRHSSDEFNSMEAVACVKWLLSEFPVLDLCISHLGGENCLATLDIVKDEPRVTFETSCLAETSL